MLSVFSPTEFQPPSSIQYFFSSLKERWGSWEDGSVEQVLYLIKVRTSVVVLEHMFSLKIKTMLIKWLLMIFCYTFRSVPYPFIIRKTSSGSWWQQRQRLTARHYAERESLSGNSLSNSFPLEFRESGGRGHTKSMRAIMVGGHPKNKTLCVN